MRIQEILIILCHYFNALWLHEHVYTVFFMQKTIVMMGLLVIFMRLQKTYWPFYFRSDNLFMDNACFMMVLAPLLKSLDFYALTLILLPFGIRTKRFGLKQD